MAVAAAPRSLRSGSLSSGEDSYSEEEDSGMGRMKSYVSQVKNQKSCNNVLQISFYHPNRHLLVLRENHHHLVQEGLPHLTTHPLVGRGLDTRRTCPLDVGAGGDIDKPPHLLRTQVGKMVK